MVIFMAPMSLWKLIAVSSIYATSIITALLAFVNLKQKQNLEFEEEWENENTVPSDTSNYEVEPIKGFVA